MPTYRQGNPSEAGGNHVEPGVYRALVEDAVEKVSQAGNDVIRLSVRIMHPSGASGPKCTENLVFTEKAFWKIDRVRAALGLSVVEGEEVDIFPEDFIDREAMVRVGEEDVAGKTYNRIEEWLLPEEALSNRRAAMPAPAPRQQPQTRPAQPAKPAQEDDDNVPF